MLWIVKLTVTPLLVGLVSYAARQWGPTIGGLLLALPWMTGPILFFIALEKGETFARDMSTGVELGAASVAFWALAYAALARRAPWMICLAAAVASYAAAGLVFGSYAFSLIGAAALAYVCSAAGYLLIPRPPEPDTLRVLPWWDIPVRMAATAVLVAVIMATSGVLGPQYSGVAATYPVIATVMTSFTHYRWGAPAAIRLLRAMLMSFISFTTYFLIVGTTIETLGIVVSFAIASLVALITSAALITLARAGLLKN